MGRIRSSRILSITLLIAVPLLGCGGGDGPERMPVYGGVEVNGVPVAKGTISLLPSAGTSGPAAITTIDAGAYEFTSETGPYPGAHHVVIEIDPSNAPAEGADAAGVQGIKFGPAAPPAKKKGAAAPPAKVRWELEYSVPAEGSEAKDFALQG